MQGDALALSVDALALSADALALSVDALALHGITKFNSLRINKMLYLVITKSSASPIKLPRRIL
ncbi:hypothetical protein LC613_03640 [Nostoc sphaeroides CHAB 2801]|uniref:hypothetical protein n=1 Tax=Nostoc sphaeroides TaxID=446679 RepID=UPI0015F31D33|nr:hypothetical protein [Nostoc sphaeroides]MCC5627303.1 hypothetical protein [Nostoc sphaeroides CHAB 2801]